MRRLGLGDVSLRHFSRLDSGHAAGVRNVIPLFEALDEAGFRSLDPWGGVSFDHSLARFHESPWHRLRMIAEVVKRTPLQMELRGRSLLGSKPYPPTVIRAFVEQAVACGVNGFLVYEPLNDLAGLSVVSQIVHDAGARLALGLVYSQGALAEDDCADVATEIAGLGCAALCLKTTEAVDPSVMGRVVRSVADAVPIPVEVDLEHAGGLGAMACVACAEAGATVLYGSVAPGWPASSVVPFWVASRLLRDAGVEVEVAEEVLASLSELLAGRFPFATTIPPAQVWAIDWRHVTRLPADLVWQVAQRLSALGAADRLAEVAAEISALRQELGGPPLAAPVAQTVATQAILNIVYGRRWEVVPDEMRAYLRKEYGAPPLRLDVDLEKHVAEHALGAGFEGGETEGGSLLEEARLALAGLQTAPGDELLHILAPGSAVPFIKKRQAAADVEALFAPGSPETDTAESQQNLMDLGPEQVRDLVQVLESSCVEEMTLENQGVKISLRKASPVLGAVAAERSVPSGQGGIATQNDMSELDSGAANEPYHKVTASMVGTFYRSPAPGVPPYVEVGSHVNAGDPLCVLEAMKLMNELLSDVAGEVVAVLVDDGAAVEYGQPLFLIEPDSD